MEVNDPLGFRHLSKPVNTLIEKIADAVGVFWEPNQIRRIADATSYARKIEAETDADLNERTLTRASHEDLRQQQNMEAITSLALPQVKSFAQPENIDPDWLVYFFNHSRLFSNEAMQSLWAKILAKEANKPGLFSKRTIAMLSTMDRKDATLFKDLCNFIWCIDTTNIALIYDHNDQVYKRHINYESLMHLASIGLIRLQSSDSLFLYELSDPLVAQYGGRGYILTAASKGRIEEINIGGVSLTATGVELLNVCDSVYDKDFFTYVENRWLNYGIKIAEFNAAPPAAQSSIR